MSVNDQKSVLDDMRYNRQLYVLGEDGMKRLTQSSVLLLGSGAVGYEVAKNLVMTGIRRLVIHDTAVVCRQDMNGNLFLNNSMIGNKRLLESLQHLKDLNPNVDIHVLEDRINTLNLSFLVDFQCVIITEKDLSIATAVDEFCRSQTPPIKFIMADARGPLCWIFCDFGLSHAVVDTDGEIPKKYSICHISNVDSITVTLDCKRHGFQAGDVVIVEEVQGMDMINGVLLKIRMVSDETFQCEPYFGSIREDVPVKQATFRAAAETSPTNVYLGGGICRQIKMTNMIAFNDLASQLCTPRMDDIVDNNNWVCHLAMLSLHSFYDKFGHLPRPWSEEDACAFVQEVKRMQHSIATISVIDESLFAKIAFTSSAILPPLTTFLGAVVAQEAIKAVTSQFMPINQWRYFHTFDLIPSENPYEDHTFCDEDWSPLSTCFGHSVVDALKRLNVFMVGCGAIGCELLKNLALLEVATETGQITVADDDVVVKSNLSQQFLFQESAIKKSKSMEAVTVINKFRPGINSRAIMQRVCATTIDGHFDNVFFESQNLVIGAVDNIEGRTLLDRCCIRAGRSYVDTGKCGNKGHVQVILPHCTESYCSQLDHLDNDLENIPYCMLKSFPSSIEHVIQWARDKFDSSFFTKPNEAKRLYDLCVAIRPFVEGEEMDDSNLSACQLDTNILKDVYSLANISSEKWRLHTWSECIVIARLKFEKYFSKKAKQLLYNFPLDLQTEDGGPFWHSPRRVPSPIEFSSQNDTHMDFIVATAKLYAGINGIIFTEEESSLDAIRKFVVTIIVPEFIPDTAKYVETDVNFVPFVANDKDATADDSLSLDFIRLTIKRAMDYDSIRPKIFDKDDENDCHVDFVHSAANLRALMYHISPADKHVTRMQSGHILPGIVTTASAIAGLACLEVVRIAKQQTREQHRNTFINLAAPLFVSSAPAPVKAISLRSDLSITLWDRWQIRGRDSFTLNDFIKALHDKYGVKATMVMKGTQLIYLPILPGHNKRLLKRMNTLVAIPKDQSSVVLSIVVETNDGDERSGPPVTYTIA